VNNLRYEDVNKILLSESPIFTIDRDDFELPYIVAGLFTKFILEAYQNGDEETYNKGLQFIEMLHLDDTHKVRELATIGYLESIQNTWPKNLIKLNIPFHDLGDESKKWWIRLNNFWNGDMNALRNDDGR